MRRKMLLIFNPTAGRGLFQDYLYEVVDKFTKNGFAVTLHPTQCKRDAYETALARGGDYDCLVCSGGDGTLNEVVDALMAMPRKPLLGYIPAGTTNDFAYSLGLSGDILLAADTICNGVPMPIDIGQFQTEFFSYVAAFGLFTDVSYGTSQSLKNILGHMAYVLEGVKRLPFIKPYHCDIVCDGEEISDDFIFGMVLNSVSVGGFRLPMVQENCLGDGAFEVILLKNINNFGELQAVIGTLMGDKCSDSIIVRTASRIQITCDGPLDWTLDGEYGGSHQQVDIYIHKHALNIIAPKPEEGGMEAE